MRQADLYVLLFISALLLLSGISAAVRKFKLLRHGVRTIAAIIDIEEHSTRRMSKLYYLLSYDIGQGAIDARCPVSSVGNDKELKIGDMLEIAVLPNDRPHRAFPSARISTRLKADIFICIALALIFAGTLFYLISY